MTIKEYILDAMGKFWTKLKSTYVTNCASTSNNLALAASQGKVLQDQITTLNSRYLPTAEYYNASAAKDCNTLTKELSLCQADSGLHYPSDSGLYYVFSYAYLKNSNGTISYGVQYAVQYNTSQHIAWQRKCLNSTWDSWVKQPTRDEITELNSKIGKFSSGINATSSSYNVNDMYTPGVYYVSSTTQNFPAGAVSTGYLLVYGLSDSVIRVCQILVDSQGTIFTRNWTGSWSAWIKQPTRSEYDALNSKRVLYVDVTGTSGTSQYGQNYYANVTIPDAARGKIVSVSIIQSNNIHFAVAQVATSDLIRVYVDEASSAFTVRIAYYG